MEPESLPWIVALVTAYIALRGVYGQRAPYESGYGLEIFAFSTVFLTVCGIGQAMFLDMSEVISLLLAGASGGFVLGLGMALARYVEGGDTSDCIGVCVFSTAIFAAVGLITGAIFLT